MNFFKNILTLCLIIIAISGSAQSTQDSKYNDCAAIFLNNELLVNEFTPSGQCIINHKASGVLSLHTVSLSEDSATPTKDLPFYIAIRHNETNTIRLHSSNLVKTIELKEITNGLSKGESIVVLTNDAAYNLIHNEITVVQD